MKHRPLTLRNRGNRKPRQLDYYCSHFPERIPVAEIDVSGDNAIAAAGMRDVYWAGEVSRQESSAENVTHIVHSGTPSKKRLDHVLVSKEFDVYQCELGTLKGHRSTDSMLVTMHPGREVRT